MNYIERFENERKEWTEKIQSFSERMKDIKNLVYLQVDLFSNRQILLEYISNLGQIIIKLNNKYKKSKSERMKYYSEVHQVRYGTNEKTPLIEGELSELKERIDILDSHISFLNETIKTIDFMIYGVKSRILLEEYLRM